MKFSLQKSGYVLDFTSNVWTRPHYESIAYIDGNDAESRLASIVREVSDLRVLSDELRTHCVDWEARYHLGAERPNIVRQFAEELKGSILEIGAGCGAITRFLGESSATVLALEGSRRRAEIARSRTRDLDNVTVLAEHFDEFNLDQKFDVVTLIGVLEYANQFSSARDDRHVGMLRRAFSFLKPGGKLILAIENQLGLKYFSGAPEDHFGRPMVGVEGRYGSNQPCTFGRVELKKMLETAGFSAQRFYAAFPDYKFALSVVSEEGFDSEFFDAEPLATQSVRRDAQLPEFSHFAQELAWPVVIKNRVALDVANSFVVLASAENVVCSGKDILASHYSMNRAERYCKEASFTLSEDGRVRVIRRTAVESSSVGELDELVLFKCEPQEDYIKGSLLSTELVRLVVQDGWRFQDLAGFIWRYLACIEQIASREGVVLRGSGASLVVPGSYLDALPQNIVIDRTGGPHLIDREWEASHEIDVGYLIFRALLALIGSVTRFGFPESGERLTRMSFVKGVLESAGFAVSEDDFARYSECEAAVQSQIVGPHAASPGWCGDRLLPMMHSSDELLDRGRYIQRLEGHVADLNRVNESLTAELKHRNEMTVKLEEAEQTICDLRVRLEGAVQTCTDSTAELDRLQQRLSLVQADCDANKSELTVATNALAAARALNSSLEDSLRNEKIEHAFVVQELAEANQALAVAKNTSSALRGEISRLLSIRDEQHSRIRLMSENILHLNRVGEVLDARERDYAQLVQSRSWKLTKPLRFGARLVRGQFSLAFEPIARNSRIKDVAVTARRAKNALAYIGRCDLKGFRDRLAFHRKEAAVVIAQQAVVRSTSMTWGILTPGHTLFIGHLIAERLQAHGWGAEITTQAPEEFLHDLYIVICPQAFQKLPPGEKRIAFQMEQSVSSRWFTDEYCKMLENSLAVLEYSLVNLDFLITKGIAYPHVHYLPIGASNTYGLGVSVPVKKYDVLFYGDSLSSSRRRRMLDALKARFKVHIVSEVFGEEMIRTLKEARVVVNIHYYENALLEMPRIQECLSLGLRVVSESSQDVGDYPELGSAVKFFDEGSIEGMLAAVDQALMAPAVSMEDVVGASQTRFSFMFDRFLVAMGFVSSSHVRDMRPLIPAGADTFGLSLPETIGRRRTFDEVRPIDCVTFDGIRRRPGWVGCGLSYSALARHALDNGLKSITVMEDDVILPPDYQQALRVIREFLSLKEGTWDVFAGVIASLHPEAKVVAVEDFGGRTFVTIDKMTSTVFNIYAESALRMFCGWDPENLDATSNTIDRYLESQKEIRVVALLPYFVGHREEVYSTLWGFQNSRYLEIIAESEAALQGKVAEFLALRT